MSDLEVIQSNLPDTLPELSKFVLVGREKLVSVRAEIRAIQNVGLAKEVLEQKKAEAQEIAELVTLSEMRIGSMLKEIPKASGGDRKSSEIKNDPVDNFDREENAIKPKAQVIQEIGFTPKQVSQFQRMAEHEDIVHEAIAEAKENDDIVSRAAVMQKIKEKEEEKKEPKAEKPPEEKPQPHVAYNSGNNEWYTPKDVIEAARKAMGSIDIDPASSEVANRVVGATEFYTAETNGLDKKLHGNVWMNPPYSADLIGKFVQKIVSERKDYKQAIVLVNNATETEWFNSLISVASAVCFPRSRVKFYMPDGKTGAPLQGQAVIYIGKNKTRFMDVFSVLGWCAVIHGLHAE